MIQPLSMECFHLIVKLKQYRLLLLELYVVFQLRQSFDSGPKVKNMKEPVIVLRNEDLRRSDLLSLHPVII